MPIVARILNALRAPQPEPLPEPDARLALGALMVQVAMSDNEYQVEEIVRIDRMLSQLYDLNPIEAAKMRATCERLHAAAPDTKTFAALIRDALEFDARREALTALWQVVLADGEIQESEINVLKRARKALGLSQADSDAARAEAEAERRTPDA